jgi:acetate kinase
MNILVLNCGSSSLKFQLISTSLEQIEGRADRMLAKGLIERIGGAALLTFQSGGSEPFRSARPIRNIRSALDAALEWISAETTEIDGVGGLGDIHAVGHRVVHGGEHFSQSVLIDDEVLRGITECIDLAPLHNPANIDGINASRAAFGRNIPQAAVFDTAFHHTMPERAYLYAIPYQFYRRHKIRRYGFHGTSHRYIAYQYRTIHGIPREDVNIITLHLGNGCSIAAVKNGNSIDTSMGFTPLEGLVMGTRSGDLDPAIIEFICDKEGMTVHEVDNLLNKSSGMLGVSGLTHDMRELIAEAEESQDRRARLAIEIFCYRIRKYIGSYLAAMNGADAIVFSGGIGENSARCRSEICGGLGWFGIHMDERQNAELSGGTAGIFSTEDSRTKLEVIPTDEELLIARDTVRLIHGAI